MSYDLQHGRGQSGPSSRRKRGRRTRLFHRELTDRLRSGVYVLHEYRYYRCAGYNKGEHPRVRVNETEFDKQLLALFGRMRIDDEKLRTWIVSVLRAKSKKAEQTADAERQTLQSELEAVRKQKQRLLDLRLLDEIEADTFAAKQNELRAKETRLLTKLEGCGRQQSERGELAVKVFELSQALGSKWLAADIAEKRLLLEIIGLNWTIDGVNLVPQMRKPFDLLAEGLLVSSSRGDDNTLEPCVYGYVAPFLYRHPDVEMAKRVLKFSVTRSSSKARDRI